MRLPALLLLAATSVLARDLPNLDAFASSTPIRPLTANDADGFVAQFEPRLGVPTFFWAAPPSPAARSPRDQGLTVEQAARRHLFSHAPLYRADAAQLAESALVRLHDTGQGVIIASFEKRVGGVSVFRDRLHVAMNQRLELVALSGYLSPAGLKQADFKLAAPTALAVAALDLAGAPMEFREGSLDEAGFRRFTAEQATSARAKKVLYALPERLVPAWYLELDLKAGTSSPSSSFVISAEDGVVLSRKNLTEADSFGYRVWAQTSGLFLPDDGPQGLAATPHPTGTPNGFSPPFLPPVLVTLQNGPISTNDPWLPSGATETTGNNVEAYGDLTAPDGFNAGDVRATTTSANTFDRVYDVTLQPDASPAQRQAGITQLFFDVNVLHDWFYDRGFNEAAGNAQTDNLSRGGAGADSIKAEAQDYGGTDNANMSTPADGARPRMQMYVWIPAGLATVAATPGGNFTAGTADFGAPSFTLTANAVLGNDGVGVVTDGCTAMTALTGKVALVDRGLCNFTVKAAAAQAAGAVGLIIIDNGAGTSPPSLPGTDATVTIPVVSLTQADGASLKTAVGAGTVSLTLTRAAVPRRSGEVDNTVVAHEWGHYLSNRLISDAAGLSTNQARSMGEGWGDFVSMLLMVRESDALVASNANWAGVWGTANYAVGGPGAPNAAYFGIRRYPYSTDLTRNPLTFKHIENGVALPVGPPVESAGVTNAEVHNSGEVWAETLWECYAGLLRASPRLTFDQARDRMMRYLVAGLKLTPTQPTFTEARDAMLTVAAAADIADYQVFATAFARRGMGPRAVAPDRNSTTHAGVVEDFNAGNDLVFVSANLDDETFYCDHDGVLDVGERGRLRIQLRNSGVNALTAITGTIASTTPGVTVVTPTVTFSNAPPFALATATGEIRLTGITAPTLISLDLTYTDPTLPSMTPRTATVTFRVNSDAAPATSATDDAETAVNPWTFVKDAAISTRFDWSRRALSPGQNVWFGMDPTARADLSLVSPPLNVAMTGNLGVVLRHRWEFETGSGANFDGAVIEVSTNGGTTWTDVGTAIAGYTGTLNGSGSVNPLVGRQAYTGQSPGYPAFITTSLNLGAGYAGQTVKLRLRVGSDFSVGLSGWDVDSIAFTGITNTPFPSLVADRGQCVNRPPVANAGPDRAVDERSLVVLDASASTDIDGNPLTARWVQTGGPMVNPTIGFFIAPEVTVDTPLTFDLVVNDGALDSAPDSLQITVRQMNRAPMADAGADLSIDERSTVTLAGSGSDPDADPVSSAWSQLSGPLGTFSDATSATTQFTAPEIGASPAVVVLQLVTSDGSLSSAPSTLTVTVQPVNRAPTVNITAPATAPERETATLTALATDPDGDALTYQWRQVSGAPVTLTAASGGASFVAPEVTGDTPLGFEVTVSDGTLSAMANATIVITNVNRAPVAVAKIAAAVNVSKVVSLDASESSDPDGDELHFAWTQTSGEPVVLKDADQATASVTLPVPRGATFKVTVSDPAGAMAEAELTIKAPTGCGCTSGGEFVAALPLLLLALRRRR